MRVELDRQLEQRAALIVRDRVTRLASQVADAARPKAPPAHVWITSEDERVRPSHADADGQKIPGNLRFKLKKQRYIRGGGRGSDISGRTVLVPGQFDLAREPRDGDLPPDQAINCRCQVLVLKGEIGRRVQVQRAVVSGKQARARVQVRFSRIAESFHGTSKDRPNRWLSEAASQVAARLR